MGGDTRVGLTVKLELQDAVHGGVVEGYIIGNLDPQGQLKEVFLHGFGKEGSTLEGWTQFAAVLLSLALQGGTDFNAVAQRVGQMRFEPYGRTNDPLIPFAPSVPAYIMAWLAIRRGDEETKENMMTLIESWTS